MKKLLSEPLLHFLLLGAAIFVAHALVAERGGDEPGRIVVRQGRVASMAEAFARARQRPPSREELDDLVRDHVREEVLCREAIALGLDKDDAIIRRRLRQKMEFLSDDIAAPAEPGDDELNAHLLAHPEAFRVEPRFTFSQVYLNPEKRGESLARDAAQMLAQLQQAGGKADASALGDASLLEHSFAATPRSEVAKQFGAAFAMKLDALSPGPWHGPIESSLGVHLVSISERMEGRLPSLADVREAVRRDWVDARRLEANEKLYQELLKRYVVTIERPEPAQEPSKVAGAR